MLKRHLACVDLKKNALVINDEVVEFLPEHQIPKDSQDNDNPTDEPSALAAQSPSTPARLGGMTAASASRGTQQQQTGTRSSGTYSEATIKTIMDLGVSRSEAIRHLDAAGGNPEVAASLIFS
ncbi:DNA damage-inducible protein 1 [Coemansia sp. RSA 1933]|nr:DNA damage-inducible protein 1 [Coemansia sp. RSA 1933]